MRLDQTVAARCEGAGDDPLAIWRAACDASDEAAKAQAVAKAYKVYALRRLWSAGMTWREVADLTGTSHQWASQLAGATHGGKYSDIELRRPATR